MPKFEGALRRPAFHWGREGKVSDHAQGLISKACQPGIRSLCSSEEQYIYFGNEHVTVETRGPVSLQHGPHILVKTLKLLGLLLLHEVASGPKPSVF